MGSVRNIILALFAINLVALLFTGFKVAKTNNLRSNQQEAFNLWYESASSNAYRFDDPVRAYWLLEKLDVFSVLDQKLSRANYSRSAGGFTLNKNYCDQHRAYFVNHPEIVFEQQNIMTNYWRRHSLRQQVFPIMGAVDLHPDVFPGPDSTKPQYKFGMNLTASMFYTYNLFYYQKQIGKEFSCLSQASNHIPGHDGMYRKDKNAGALVKYVDSYKSRPQCFSFDRFFLRTWILSQKDQCERFFAEFNSPRYQQMKEERNVVYFRKIGADAHEGSGVFPVTDDEEAHIRKIYKNGQLCGQNKENNLMQYNVWNPLLVQNRKFGFRMFMLVASTNPLIAYYHDGYLRLSIDPYNPKSKDKTTFVTNIGVSLKEAKKDNLFDGMTEKEIHEYTAWSLEQLQDYLIERGLVQDPNWLNNYLRPQFKKVMMHLLRMAQSQFAKKSSVFELLGLDYVMDDQMGVWFIEANTMPLIDGFTKNTTKMFNKMLVDTFEIVYGLLRSRMKRVIQYINYLNQELDRTAMNTIPNLKKRQEEFKLLTTNRFEPEFKPSPQNGFDVIIDENQSGTARYANLLEAECF